MIFAVLSLIFGLIGSSIFAYIAIRGLQKSFLELSRVLTDSIESTNLAFASFNQELTLLSATFLKLIEDMTAHEEMLFVIDQELELGLYEDESSDEENDSNHTLN